MCNGTHSKAGNASTNDHVCDFDNSSVAVSGVVSTDNSERTSGNYLSQKVSSEQSQSSTETNETCIAGTDTSADAIQFLRLKVDEKGLLLKSEYLGCDALDNVFSPGTEVSFMLRSCERGGTAVITTDPLKRSLLKSAEELQLRQDELKEDFSSGILHLVNAVN